MLSTYKTKDDFLAGVSAQLDTHLAQMEQSSAASGGS
jgi:hypothetical protein